LELIAQVRDLGFERGNLFLQQARAFGKRISLFAEPWHGKLMSQDQ
jgi:hypothetical protein